MRACEVHVHSGFEVSNNGATDKGRDTQNYNERQDEDIYNPNLKLTLRAWKNHLFLPPVYRSSKSFFICFFASSRCDGSLKVSAATVPLRPSNSSA